MKFTSFLSALLLTIPSLITTISPGFSQENLPVCQPPTPGEYVLLIVSPTDESQKQLSKALPSDLKMVNCKYLNEKVIRIGGFNKIDDANRWSRYVNNIVGLTAIVTTRPATPKATPSQTANYTTPKATPSQTTSYNPKVLGDGYAVLVDYFNRPELANSLQKAVGGDVGLVSYGQRPYLLAVYTTSQKEANNTLEKLNENGFFATLADGRKVMLLRSVVTVK